MNRYTPTDRTPSSSNSHRELQRTRDEELQDRPELSITDLPVCRDDRPHPRKNPR